MSSVSSRIGPAGRAGIWRGAAKTIQGAIIMAFLSSDEVGGGHYGGAGGRWHAPPSEPDLTPPRRAVHSSHSSLHTRRARIMRSAA